MCSEIVLRQKNVFTIQLNLSDEKIPLYIKWVEKGTDWMAPYISSSELHWERTGTVLPSNRDLVVLDKGLSNKYTEKT